MIAGVEMQDSGTIHVDGKLICDTVLSRPARAARDWADVSGFALFPHLSVADNVAYGLRGAKAEKRARVEELLDRVGSERFHRRLSASAVRRGAAARGAGPRACAPPGSC